MKVINNYLFKLMIIVGFLLSEIVINISFFYSSRSIKTSVLFNILSIIFCVIFLMLTGLKRNKRTISARRHFLSGLLVGFFAFAINLLVIALVYKIKIKINTEFKIDNLIKKLLFQLLVALSEELKFRNIFLKIIDDVIKNHKFEIEAYFFLSFVFAIWHVWLGGGMIQFTCVFIFSLIVYLGLKEYNEEGIFSAVTAHFFYNIFMKVIIFYS